MDRSISDSITTSNQVIVLLLLAVSADQDIIYGPGGVLSPFDGGGGGGVAWKKYRGVRELFIPQKGWFGHLGNWNKHRPKAVVGEDAGGGVPLTQGGSGMLGGPHPEFFCYLDALWCNLRHFEPKYKSSK